MADPIFAKTNQYQIDLDGDLGTFQGTLSVSSDTNGLEFVTLHLTSPTVARLPKVSLRWSVPIVDVQTQWSPGIGWNRGLSVAWGHGMHSKATSNAPVVCMTNLRGQNRLTFAFSDALNPLRLKSGVHEETATFHCSLDLFTEPGPPVSEYEAILRLDTRDVPYYESLGQVGEWWAEQPGYTPAPVPEIARLPMYSTWYSFHQDITAPGIEEQCRLAKDLGCHAVIVDDGWQTTNSERGYAYCGDWIAVPERIADMKAHVKAVHEIGLKYLLWYSVPFVGEYSDAWSRFSDKFLSFWDQHGKTAVLDPRFPEVREYLITLYENAMRDWDLDGFKLDFVDSFNLLPERSHELGNGRDLDSVPEAVDRLLSDVIERLSKIKPDVMIGFRQSYIGPLMRKYGNMFRAGDCPNDTLGNRQRTIDIRLLCGSTAAHSDMMMWHPDDSVEAAALQIINTLFSVPQLSVLIDRVPETHVQMMRYWMSFWQTHRDVLLDGKLMPLYPEMMYPIVIADNPSKRLIAAYANMVIQPGQAVPSELWLINGTEGASLTLEISEALKDRTLIVRNCLGEIVREDQVTLSQGLISIPIPASGTACLAAAEPELRKDL